MNIVFKSRRDFSQSVEFGKLSNKLVKLKAAILRAIYRIIFGKTKMYIKDFCLVNVYIIKIGNIFTISGHIKVQIVVT